MDVILNVSYNDTTAVKRQMCLSQNDIQHKQKHSITSKLDINHIMHSINDTMNMITNVTLLLQDNRRDNMNNDHCF